MRADWIGQVIDGKFLLLQWLGGSELGGVFLTELEGPESQKAAIKLMRADAVGAEAHVNGWAVTAPLSHRHLMRLFHFGRCEIGAVPLLYAVTEYAEENLAQLLPERPLTPVEAREMIGPVLDALSYLHERGLVHGHLKPSNLMGVDDRLKLSCDSIHISGESGRHFPTSGVYEAPETATGEISPASDVWSLGITLVEALTQHPAVWDRSAVKAPIVPETIPEPFAAIARGCLQLEPQRRYTIGEIAARLEPARPSPGTPAKTRRTAPAKRRLALLVSAAVVLLAVFAVVQLRSHRDEPSPEAGTSEPAPAVSVPQPQASAPRAETSKGMVVKGAVARQVLPDVPEAAIQTIHGRFALSIRATVDQGGDVSNAEVDSPGPSRYFASLSLQAAKKWKFNPAQVDGQAVSSMWVLRFEFSQAATEVAPVEVSP
jgi:TonB family protein